MPKLFVNPNSPGAWEIHLKSGVNRLGRGAANDFTLTDPTVSGSHCEIVVAAQSVAIKDLGSTNGTVVNRAPVVEAVLHEGDRIQLGGVELVYAAEGAAAPTPAKTQAAPVRAGTPASPAAVASAKAPAGSPASPAQAKTQAVRLPPPPAKPFVARVVSNPASGPAAVPQPAPVIPARPPPPGP
ncbi:MAG TPA: FHA domain-containing protein [Dongiaceae bacterium]|nr:FHA domain-containing protein [Dongiaceae bacterium]